MATTKLLDELSLDNHVANFNDVQRFRRDTPADVAFVVTSTADGVRIGRRNAATFAHTSAAAHAPITAAFDAVVLILAAIRIERHGNNGMGFVTRLGRIVIV